MLCLSPSTGYAADYKCPDSISANHTLMEPLEAGSPWTSYSAESAGAQTFSGITVFDGPPEEMASLVPATEGEQQVWTFSAQKSRKIWVQCDYANTSLKLVQAMPDAVTRCAVATPGTVSCQ